MRNEKTMINNTGIGFTGLLQIVFIILKLCKVINWSWWLVCLPAIISVGLTILLYLLALILSGRE